MEAIFLLSGENIQLAKEEVFSLISFHDFKLIDKLLIVKNKNVNSLNEKTIKKLSKRLALTKAIYHLLFKCSIEDLIKRIKHYNWNSIYKDNFCVRTHYLDCAIIFSEKFIAEVVWDKLKNPKVNLGNPKTKIEFFFCGRDVYCCILMAEIKDNYEERKAHNRPFPHPSSLHPRIARALVNLTGANRGDTIIDPFCGSGGFLIEAGLMGIGVIGYDFYKEMIEGCKKNFDFFNIQKYRLYNKNALEIGQCGYVVTDFPYGLNSTLYLTSINNGSYKKISIKGDKKNKKYLEEFYLTFLKKLKIVLNKKAVIVFPNFVDYKKIIGKARLKLKDEFSIYVHKSLTRKIVVLE